jgi:Domain of unknown function (DUF6265)
MLILFLLAASGDIDKLDWMAGCHVLETPRVKIEEQWMKPGGGMMLGVNRTIRGGKAVEHEFLRIDAKAGEVVYTGLVGTKGETPFRLIAQSDTEVIFENPTHDFPQRIIYRKTPEGLFARIDGTVNGKERHQDFPFKSAPCK